MLILADDRDVDRPQRMMFDSPHLVSIINKCFVGPTVNLGDLIGSKFQRGSGRRTRSHQS
jgi:hypothetical protein